MRAVSATWSESVRSIVRAIFTRNSWQGEKKGGEGGKGKERGRRNERGVWETGKGNEGDDLSPSFCSPPALAVHRRPGYLSLPRFSFVRYSSSFSLLSSLPRYVGRATGKAREWLSSHGLLGYEFSFG